MKFARTLNLILLITLAASAAFALTPYTLKVPAVNKTVTDATNASPIVITATGHGFLTADRVNVTGVVGNTAANGWWTITVVDADSFSLDDSTGNGTYTSGGKAYLVTPVTRDTSIHCARVAFMPDTVYFGGATYLGTKDLNKDTGAGVIQSPYTSLPFTIEVIGRGNPLQLSDFFVYGTASAPSSGLLVVYWID